MAVRGAYGADGTEYRTEIDGFSKIVSRGRAGTGPARFEVRTKSGQTMQFGNTADSRIEAVGRSEVRQWALNRVTDAVGNYLTLRYREEGGQGYPDRIDYTGHDTGGAPYASVRFAYQTRHDVRVLASGGSTMRIDERLAKVRTYHGATLVSEYRLTYAADGVQPSRVIRVERCDREGACLPASNFSWNDFGNGTLAPAEGGTAASGDFSKYRPLQGDFDGDGVTDLAWAHARNGGLRAYVALGAGDGTLAAAQQSDPKTSGRHSGYEPLVGDFNGDGLSDIAWTKETSSSLQAWVALGRGNGTVATATYFNPGAGNFSGYKPLVGDFNGDGRSDIAWTRAYSSGLRARVALGGGNGTLAAAVPSSPKNGNFSDYKALVGDFNGDGLSDIVWTRANSSGLHAWVALGGGNGTLAAALPSRPRTRDSSGYQSLVGDFNGDGAADLVWTNNAEYNSNAYTALGKGNGRFGAATHSTLRTSRCRYCSRNPSTGDFNGDGVSDITWAGTRYIKQRQCGGVFNLDCWHKRRHNWARAEISLGEGDGGFASARVYEHYRYRHWSGYASLVGDFDGDGVSDVAWTKAAYAYTALNQAPPDHGRVSSISSTTGPTFRLDYAPLTHASIYSKDTGEDACGLPCLDVQMPLHVVRTAAKYYGRLSHRTTYRYGGAKVDIAGRGFLGFRWMEARDRTTGVRTSTEYRQNFPYIGQVSASSRFLADGTALSAEENSWARMSLNGGKTTFPYISTSVAESYELNDGSGNEPVTTVTTTSTYDAYGNPTAMTVTTAGAGGSFVKRTTNSYTNDTANWHLGRLTCARVISEAPGQAARTRVSGFAYDAATGLLKKEAVEPGAGDVAGCVSAAAGSGITLITAHAYDAYGNRNRATVSGPGIAARATATAWGERAADGTVTANGRFAVAATNALGHAEQRWHDPAYGGATGLRGPNGLETAWEYDGFGRPLREARADGTETVTAFLSCSETGVTCPAGAVRAVRVRASGAAPALRYLDRRGMELRVQTAGFDGTAIYSDTAYDALGRAISRSRPYYAGGTAQWTRLAYDAAGRTIRETRPDGSRTEIAHDGLVDGAAVRQRVKVFPAGSGAGDANARIATRDSDALGRLVKVTDPLGSATTYVRDALGNLTGTTDASGNVVTLAYDLRGRKTAMDDPDMGRWTYTRNALGELVSQRDARGRTASMTYDALGRMTRRVEPEGVSTWSHDGAVKGIGKPHLVSGPGGYARTHAYDGLGRPESETFVIGGESFRVGRSYDALGRVATLAYPRTGIAVGRSYTERGHLRAVYDTENPATVYWRAAAVNAEGQVLEAMLGNGIGTTRTYDPATGLIRTIQSGVGDSAAMQDLGYVFDSLGNLTSREDFIQGVYESFAYDRLNRLTGATVYDAEDDTGRAAKTYRYDAIGNIVNKSDLGAANYVYGTGNAAGAGDAGPHAVVSAGGNTYAYDDNGNMVSGAGRTLTWTSFNKPASVVDATTTTRFAHGPDRARIVQTRTQGATTTAIVYVAGLFEQLGKTGEATKFVHYIFAGSSRVAIRTTDDAPAPTDKLRYLHRDHLGSVDTITDAAGAVLERLSYDAFGKRRVAAGASAWTDPALAIAAVNTPRGFTGHEHLDDFQLVHMNGRVYDPALGRFLSADPFVQFPESTQGLNRYSYAANNPLSFTDPSGYFIGKLFKVFRNFFRKILSIPIVNTIANIAMIAACGTTGPAAPGCIALGTAGLTAAAGGDIGDIIRASAIAFASAHAFQYVGHGMPLPKDQGLRYLAKSVAHGVVGGVRSVASGGKFGPGFLSAGFTQLASPAIGRIGGDGAGGASARVIAAAVVGGTASKLGGGKFANGAVTGAFLWMYNHERRDGRAHEHEPCPEGPLMCRAADTGGVGYGRKTTFFGFSEEAKWGRYKCFGQGGHCSFVGPGDGENLYGVVETKRYSLAFGDFAAHQRITTFKVDRSSWWHRTRYGPEFLDAMQRNLQDCKSADLCK